MANRFPLIFNSGAGQIQELAASDNLDLTSSNLVNAGILFTSSGSQTAPSISIGNGTTYPPGLYSPGTDQLAVATNGTGKVLVDTNGTILVNTTIQATSNGGLNIENTGAGTFTSPLALLNRGTTNNTGVSLSFRGLSAASAETDYAYLRMLATDTTSRHGRIEFWTANSGTVTEKLCITRDGLVGIGNSGPSAKLDVTVSVNIPATGSPDAGSFITARGNTATVGYGPSFALSNVSGAKETSWRISAVTASSNNGDLVFNGYNGGADLPERMRITSAGLLGIGTSVPNYQLHATTSFAVGAAGFNQQLSFTNDTIQSLILGTGYTPLKLNPSGGNLLVGTTSNANGGQVEAKTAMVVSGNPAYDKKAFIAQIPYATTNITSSLLAGFDSNIHGVDLGYRYNSTGYDLCFATNSTTTGSPTERMRIKSNGDVSIVTGNLIIGTAGKGIDFSADGQAAGMTSELLDDYEEGTFTPSLGGDTTYSVQQGFYTKIGNVVTVWMDISVTTLGTGSTTTLTGLPFAMGSVASYPGSTGYFASLAISVVHISPIVTASTTAKFMTLTAASTTVTDGGAIFGNSARIICSVTYQV